MGEAKRRVLIADDTNVHRRMLTDMLVPQYEVVEAKDGEEALRILEEQNDSIAIVLLDIVMPKKDGFDVLEAMNERGWISKLPVLMITAEYSDEYITKANRLGAIDYIIKPFNPVTLVAKAKLSVKVNIKFLIMYFLNHSIIPVLQICDK